MERMVSPEDMGPIEEDQPLPPEDKNDKVVPFPAVPWRYTPELIIRSLFGHLDRVESIVAFVTYKGSPNPAILKSPNISPSSWLALSAVAYKHGVEDLIMREPESPIPENRE